MTPHPNSMAAVTAEVIAEFENFMRGEKPPHSNLSQAINSPAVEQTEPDPVWADEFCDGPSDSAAVDGRVRQFREKLQDYHRRQLAWDMTNGEREIRDAAKEQYEDPDQT